MYGFSSHIYMDSNIWTLKMEIQTTGLSLYIYIDVGHIAENLALASVGLELGSCQIGALFDDELNTILGVDGVEESAIYMSVVGMPRDDWSS